jgi:hypothetical protein
MLINYLALLAAGVLAGGGIGAGLSATGVFDSEESGGGSASGFVDVYSCPSAEGSIGQLARGDRVLLTAVGPDGQFYEINYPLSPNGRAWIEVEQVSADESTGSLPESNCRSLFTAETGPQTSEDDEEATPTATPDGTTTPTTEATVQGDDDDDGTRSDDGDSPAEDETPPTQVPPTAEPTQPPDTTPPVITQGSVGPAQINENQPQACVQRPTTVQVSAIVSDEGGVAEVRVVYSLADTSGFTDKAMTASGGQYTASVGPFAVSSSTNVTFTVIARDEAGNESTANVGSTFVNECSFN